MHRYLEIKGALCCLERPAGLCDPQKDLQQGLKSIVGRVLALQVPDQISILAYHMVSQTPPEMIPKHIARNNC